MHNRYVQNPEDRITNFDTFMQDFKVKRKLNWQRLSEVNCKCLVHYKQLVIIELIVIKQNGRII